MLGSSNKINFSIYYNDLIVLLFKRKIGKNCSGSSVGSISRYISYRELGIAVCIVSRYTPLVIFVSGDIAGVERSLQLPPFFPS